MTCDEVKELQSNYFDQELIDDARRRVDEHLKTCPVCSADFQAMAQTIDKIRAESGRLTPPHWFSDRLMERLEQQIDTNSDHVERNQASQLRLLGL